MRIPKRVNMPSDEIFAFLYQKFSEGGSPAGHEALTDFVRHKEQQYGQASSGTLVWTHGTREYLWYRREYPGLRQFFLGVMIAGLIWLLASLLFKELNIWMGIGVGVAFVGGLGWLLNLVMPDLVRVPGFLLGASLVICPDSLAMTQGDLTGQMRWAELRGVEYKKRVAWSVGKGSMVPAGPGIVLKVAGATIYITISTIP